VAFQPEDILEGGRSIRPFLPELLGNDAVQVDKQLAELLAKAMAGQQVEQQILEILKSHPDTRNWIAEFLSNTKLGKEVLIE